MATQVDKLKERSVFLANKVKNFEDAISQIDGFIREAHLTAARINRDRFEGKVPCADDTVRMMELLDKIDFNQ